jgi:nucleotide-binding universal stress UspA family protein
MRGCSLGIGGLNIKGRSSEQKERSFMKPIRRIMHPTDFSSASRRALDTAVDFAKQNKAELLLVHVLVPYITYPVDGYSDPSLYVEVEGITLRQAQASLEALVAKVKKARVDVRGLVLKGTVHDQIIRAARSRRADLIVIGTHGRTGISKLFMGSVAGRVVSGASCPVLTVRGK